MKSYRKSQVILLLLNFSKCIKVLKSRAVNYFSLCDLLYRCISKNLNVVEKFIYFSNSTQIVKLVYYIKSMHTD